MRNGYLKLCWNLLETRLIPSRTEKNGSAAGTFAKYSDSSETTFVLLCAIYLGYFQVKFILYFVPPYGYIMRIKID